MQAPQRQKVTLIDEDGHLLFFFFMVITKGNL